MSLQEREIQEDDISQAQELLTRVKSEINKHVVGQNKLKERLLVALIAGGHILLEGVPGLAKTLSIRALARSVDGSFRRIQFTPDLLPSDIIGSEIYRPAEGQFITREGPVFANFVLADEINRAPAKVQSALLETMQEGQATIGDKTLHLPKPFFVLATQNPLEQEGTYTLPEAQIDRFMLKLIVGYPSPEEETQILNIVSDGKNEEVSLQPQMSLEQLKIIQEVASRIYVDEKIKKYIVDIVTATRSINQKFIKDKSTSRLIEIGASPRASISFFMASKAYAVISGSRFVTPQMIKELAFDILRHRIILSYEAELEQITVEDLIQEILSSTPVP